MCLGEHNFFFFLMLINIREVSRANVTIHMLYSSTSSEMGRDKKKIG